MRTHIILIFGRDGVNELVLGHEKLSGALVLARMLYKVCLALLRHCELVFVLVRSDQSGLDGRGNL